MPEAKQLIPGSGRAWGMEKTAGKMQQAAGICATP